MYNKLQKIRSKKGFTLMELLIVVAIIAILVAIAIPTMSSALQKSKESADVANVRAWYAEVLVKNMTVADETTIDWPTTYGGDQALNYADKFDGAAYDKTNDQFQVSYTGKYYSLHIPTTYTGTAAGGTGTGG